MDAPGPGALRVPCAACCAGGECTRGDGGGGCFCERDRLGSCNVTFACAGFHPSSLFALGAVCRPAPTRARASFSGGRGVLASRRGCAVFAAVAAFRTGEAEANAPCVAVPSGVACPSTRNALRARVAVRAASACEQTSSEFPALPCRPWTRRTPTAAAVISATSAFSAPAAAAIVAAAYFAAVAAESQTDTAATTGLYQRLADVPLHGHSHEHDRRSKGTYTKHNCSGCTRKCHFGGGHANRFLPSGRRDPKQQQGDARGGFSRV